MPSSTIRQSINRKLDGMPEAMQKRILDYIMHINEPHQHIPPGIPGKDVKKNMTNLAPLSLEDADELTKIINEGCERIDYNEW